MSMSYDRQCFVIGSCARRVRKIMFASYMSFMWRSNQQARRTKQLFRAFVSFTRVVVCSRVAVESIGASDKQSMFEHAQVTQNVF